MRGNSLWHKAAEKRISVLVVGHRNPTILRAAVESLYHWGSPDLYELILLVNGDDPAVAKEMERLHAAAKVPALLLQCVEERPGFARSLAIPYARGEVVFFLDDDVELFQDVVSRIAELFQDKDLVAAGGANLTPPDSGVLERASGAVLESFWGTMAMRFRYQQNKVAANCTEHSLILCNLAIRRAVLERSGGFPHGHLVSNEENVLLQQLSRMGCTMRTDPGLAVFHRRRNSWRGIAQQSRKYGFGRGQNILLQPDSLRFLYFLPSLLLFSLLWSVVPFLLYFGVGVCFSLWHFLRTRDLPVLTLQPFVYPLVHLAYGWGFFLAMVRWGWRREVLCGVVD